jgi:hypothetical protein
LAQSVFKYNGSLLGYLQKRNEEGREQERESDINNVEKNNKKKRNAELMELLKS